MVYWFLRQYLVRHRYEFYTCFIFWTSHVILSGIIFQHSDAKALQKYGLKQAEEIVVSRPTSTGEYRQPTSQKLVCFVYFIHVLKFICSLNNAIIILFILKYLTFWTPLDFFGGLLHAVLFYICFDLYQRVKIVVFNATFNNISAISWRSVLLVEESGVPWENHQPAASHWQIKVDDIINIL